MVGRQHTADLWDLTTGVGRVLRGHKGPVAGALPAAGRAGAVVVGRRRLGFGIGNRRGACAQNHKEPVAGALMLPDGGALSWSHDGTLQVWDLTRRRGARLLATVGESRERVLLRDGRALSWSVDRTLRVWDLARQARGEHSSVMRSGLLARCN